MTYNQILLIVYIAFIIIMSFIALIAYKKDKEKAKSGQIRTKEKVLLFLSGFGGACGAFIARKKYHHKTEKIYFSIVIYLSLVLEILVLALLVYGGLIK